jgi:hypothetical protein
MNIRILDDKYWDRIYQGLKVSLPWYDYPIRDNVFDPCPYLENIQNWDIILLDNYFPWETWEEPLGDSFLEEYLDKKLKCKIICISDYWKVLLDKYFNREEVNKKWDVIGWVTSKDPKEISNIIKKRSETWSL